MPQLKDLFNNQLVQIIGVSTIILASTIGTGGCVYLTHKGKSLREYERAETARYKAIERIAEQYAERMSPEKFKNYLRDLGLTKIEGK
jgi:radical SAM superfamily enzyme